MPDPKVLYVFTRGERGIFEEIYFPKKAIYQGTVFDTLKDGLKVEVVRKYLSDNVEGLLQELKDYRGLFDPRQYEKELRKKFQPTPAQALERINMYESPFRGWSMDEVDGVWQGEEGVPIEERTQVIRIMFRLPSRYLQEAVQSECFDVLRSMLFWCITNQGNLDEHVWWGKAEQRRFIARHKPWPTKRKLAFTEKYFRPVAKEVAKWRDDCALFIYGYLVKNFAANVLVKGTKEQVIWVTSFFNLTINEIQRVELPS